MFRKIVIFPMWLAVLMIAITSFVPHHHHGAMICAAQEICEFDGHCDDEHTQHPQHQEDETHCVAHENYLLSHVQRVDAPIFEMVQVTIICEEIQEVLFSQFWQRLQREFFEDPEIYTLDSPPIFPFAPNAPPVFLS